MSQRILVTGAGSGFGYLTVKSLAREGHSVYAGLRQISGRNAGAAQALAAWGRTQRGFVKVLELDVTEHSSVVGAVTEIIDTEGGIDVVVNNAGVLGVGVNEAFSVDNLKTIFETNVFGPFRVIKAVLPQMRRQRSGLLIQISSILGRALFPFSGIYCASKFAVEALAESFYYDLGPLGIESVIIEPGPFPTEQANKALPPDHAEVISEYESLRDALQRFSGWFENFFQAPDSPNPQAVADVVKQLIDMPAGKRPLRTVVDPMRGKIDTLNQTAQAVQSHLFKTLRMEKFK